jgi:hypothetical protein
MAKIDSWVISESPPKKTQHPVIFSQKAAPIILIKQLFLPPHSKTTK